MSKLRKSKHAERPVFDSLRKPIAPPSVRIGRDKPEEVIHPSLRKSKHKNKVVISNDDE